MAATLTPEEKLKQANKKIRTLQGQVRYYRNIELFEQRRREHQKKENEAKNFFAFLLGFLIFIIAAVVFRKEVFGGLLLTLAWLFRIVEKALRGLGAPLEGNI